MVIFFCFAMCIFQLLLLNDVEHRRIMCGVGQIENEELCRRQIKNKFHCVLVQPQQYNLVQEYIDHNKNFNAIL